MIRPSVVIIWNPPRDSGNPKDDGARQRGEENPITAYLALEGQAILVPSIEDPILIISRKAIRISRFGTKHFVCVPPIVFIESGHDENRQS